MTNYYVNLNFQDQETTDQNLMNVINEVTEEDELVVNVGADRHDEIETTAKILDENGFEHITKGSDTGRQLSIIAHLKKSK